MENYIIIILENVFHKQFELIFEWRGWREPESGQNSSVLIVKPLLRTVLRTLNYNKRTINVL